MTYPKSYKNSLGNSPRIVGRRLPSRGIILVDMMLAFSIGILFIAILATAHDDADALYTRARDRAAALDMYQNGDAVASTTLYGNDATETFFMAASSTISSGVISFRRVSAIDAIHSAGTPLCAVDFVGAGRVATPHIQAITLPVDPLLPLTDLQVRDGIAYVSTDSNVTVDPDLLVVDIRDEGHPQIVSSLNTGPGIVALSLAGKRIYAAASSVAGQLHVIRLDSLATPILETKFKLALPYATATAPLASSIFYDRGHVYLGTEKWDGEEFVIFDMANPPVPLKIGSFEIGSKVNSILVKNGYAYLSTAAQGQLQILDVRDPARPRLVQGFAPSGWSRQEGRTENMFETGLTFGRTSGGYNVTSDAELFGWLGTSTTLTAPTFADDISGGVYGIVSDRKYLYLATRTVNSEFQIRDRYTGALLASVSLPVAPQSLTCDAGHLYLLAHTAAVMYDISF